MKSKNRYTCLQLTHTTVRRVDISEKAGILSQVRAESAPIPETGHPINAVVEPVRNLLSGLKSQTVFVSISSNEVLLKRVEMPTAVPNADAESQNAAILTALEHENHIPVSLNAVAYDFHLMTKTDLLVGWMRKGILYHLNKELNESGIELAVLTPQPVVLANQLLTESTSPGRVCGICIDEGACDLVVIEADAVYLGRSFSIEKNDVLKTVTQTLANCPVKRIVLFQGERDICIDAKELTEALGTDDCEVMTTTLDWANALCRPILRNEGIAMNLLAPIHAQQNALTKQRRKQRLMQLTPIATVLLLLCANVTLFYEVDKKKDRLNALHQKREQVKTVQAKTESLQTEYAAETDALAQLRWGAQSPPPLAKRFAQIAEKIPMTVQLTEIKTVPPPRGAKGYVQFDARKTLLLIGEANAQSEIDAFRVALLTQPEFTTVRQIATEPISRAGEKRLLFTLQLASKGDTP